MQYCANIFDIKWNYHNKFLKKHIHSLRLADVSFLAWIWANSDIDLAGGQLLLVSFKGRACLWNQAIRGCPVIFHQKIWSAERILKRKVHREKANLENVPFIESKVGFNDFSFKWSRCYHLTIKYEDWMLLSFFFFFFNETQSTKCFSMHYDIVDKEVRQP